MTTLRNTLTNVVQFCPKIVREMRERVDPLQLKQQVMSEIDWQLSRLDSKDDERSVLKFLIEHRGLDAEDE